MSFKLSDDGKKDIGGGGGGMRSLLQKTSKVAPNTFDAVAGIQYKMNRRLSTMRRSSFVAPSSTEDALWAYEHQVNTYRLGPTENQKFSAPVVQKVVADILDSFLAGEKYSASRSAQMTQHLCELIKARVRELRIQRHKVVCYVLIGQNLDQGVTHCSRCVWDTQTDNFATATFKNGSLFAVATVYGFYYE